MSDLSSYIAPAIVVIAIFVCFKIARREGEKKTRKMDRLNFIVRSPKLYTIVGLVDLVLFGGLCVMFLITGNDSADIFVFITFIGFALLGFFILIYALRCKVVVEGDQISVTHMFKPKQDYSVRDITHIKVSTNLGVRIFSDRRKLFYVDIFGVGCGALIAYLIEHGVKVPDRINLPRY